METAVIDLPGKGVWQDNTIKGASLFLGKDEHFFSSIQRHTPKKWEAIKHFGGGSIVMGYIRLQAEMSEKLYQFGELYNILEEAKFKPIEFFPKEEKQFKRIRAYSFSSPEQIMTLEEIQALKRYVKEMAILADKHGLLKKYNIKKDEYV